MFMGQKRISAESGAKKIREDRRTNFVPQLHLLTVFLTMIINIRITVYMFILTCRDEDINAVDLV